MYRAVRVLHIPRKWLTSPPFIHPSPRHITFTFFFFLCTYMTVICNGLLQISKRQSNKLTNKTKTKTAHNKVYFELSVFISVLLLWNSYISISILVLQEQNFSYKEKKSFKKNIKKKLFFFPLSVSLSTYIIQHDYKCKLQTDYMSYRQRNKTLHNIVKEPTEAPSTTNSSENNFIISYFLPIT